MGQRGQVFIIAKVNGKYRTLAVCHNQWLYGIDTLLTILHVIKVFTAEENRLHIRRELHRAENTDWKQGAVSIDSAIQCMHLFKSTQRLIVAAYQASASTFPFIATCLSVAAGLFRFNYEEVPNIIMLPIKVRWNQVDNDDGISVIDITDLANPSYCILFPQDREYYEERDEIDNFDEEPEEAPADCTPGKTALDGKGYLWAYDRSETYSSTLDTISTLPVIPATTLKDLWPNADWKDAVERPAAATPSKPSTVSHLKDLSLTTLLDEALNGDPQNVAWLPKAGEIHDFDVVVRSKFYDDPVLLQRPSGPTILAYVLRDANVIDLSLFNHLTTSGVRSILHQIHTQSAQRRPRTLLLPDLETMTASQLSDILSVVPVHELHLGKVGIDMDAVLSAVDSSSVTALTSSWLYERPFELTAHRPNPRDDHMSYSNIVAGAPRVFQSTRKFPVAQVVYIRQNFRSDNPRLDDEGLEWSQLAESNTIVGSNSLMDPNVLAMPLDDFLLSGKDFVDRLPTVFSRLTALSDMAFHMTMFMAKAGMGTAQQIALGKDDRVRPLPAQAYVANKKASNSNWGPPPLVLPLRRGHWTVCVYHEQPSKYIPSKYSDAIESGPSLRYAFVSISEETDLVVLDTKAFLEATRPSNSTECSSELESCLPVWEKEISALEDTMTSRMESLSNGQRARVSLASSAEVAESLHLMAKYNREIVNFRERLPVQPETPEPDDEFPVGLDAILQRLELRKREQV